MIPQMIPLFGDQEKENVTQYMDNVGFITEFQLTSEFEREIEKYTDIKNIIVCNHVELQRYIIDTYYSEEMM